MKIWLNVSPSLFVLTPVIYESPLFVGQLSKRALRHSLWNDTLLLAKMNVMDYSLVIGIDEENKELILGIIDFIRTFTWDKKLESWVKERGLVGGGTKEPTIVTPRQYKNRYVSPLHLSNIQIPRQYGAIFLASTKLLQHTRYTEGLRYQQGYAFQIKGKIVSIKDKYLIVSIKSRNKYTSVSSCCPGDSPLSHTIECGDPTLSLH